MTPILKAKQGMSLNRAVDDLQYLATCMGSGEADGLRMAVVVDRTELLSQGSCILQASKPL